MRYELVIQIPGGGPLHLEVTVGDPTLEGKVEDLMLDLRQGLTEQGWEVGKVYRITTTTQVIDRE